MRRFVTSLVAILSAVQLVAQQLPERPKLVVTITVDQLRTDLLYLFYEAFGENGFKRLINQGAVSFDMSFPFDNLDQSNSIATIFTGTTPFYHGVVGNEIYNPKRNSHTPILLDREYMGNFSPETLSPRALLTSTISDELKVASDNLSEIYSVAPTAEQAILSAGHASNAAFWIDNTTGMWATSTYYRDAPYYFENYNVVDPLNQRIEESDWSLQNSPSFYRYLPFSQRDFGFKHTFSKSKLDNVKLYKQTPLVNQEVGRFVSLLFKNSTLGKKSNPDMLNVTYFAGSYQGRSVSDNSLEIQDTYIRLDQEIARLLLEIDANVGLKNALVVLTSTGYFDASVESPERMRIPSGDFYPRRATSLLNVYLMAIYGQGQWVDGYSNGELYLNKKLIDDKQISLSEIQTKSAEFLVQMSGVQDVVCSHTLMHGMTNDANQLQRNRYHRKLSGDLLLEFQPGWNINFEGERKNQQVRASTFSAPLIFFGTNIVPQKIERTISATEIAPTVCSFLRIRAPNGSREKPIRELFRR
ncbi:MAG: alkaline phosphatase family protein [Bacteroidales bacterium]